MPQQSATTTPVTPPQLPSTHYSHPPIQHQSTHHSCLPVRWVSRWWHTSRRLDSEGNQARSRSPLVSLNYSQAGEAGEAGEGCASNHIAGSSTTGRGLLRTHNPSASSRTMRMPPAHPTPNLYGKEGAWRMGGFGSFCLLLSLCLRQLGWAELEAAKGACASLCGCVAGLDGGLGFGPKGHQLQ